MKGEDAKTEHTEKVKNINVVERKDRRLVYTYTLLSLEGTRQKEA